MTTSILVNLVSLIPALRGNPVYEGLTSLLAGVLKKRTEPEELPVPHVSPGTISVSCL